MRSVGARAKLSSSMPAPDDARSLTAAGFAALKRGDDAGARALFQRATEAPGATADSWYGLALTQGKLNASESQGAALERALGLDASHLPALIARGDLYLRQGDERAASAYYGTALRGAAAQASVPPEWRSELERVRTAREALTRRFEERLLGALAGQGLGAPGSERVVEAVDLLLGRRQLFQQQPRYFYFPGLPQVQFYPREAFAWRPAIEARSAEIRAELQELLSGAAAGFVPYIQREQHRPLVNPNPLMGKLDWSAYYLIKDGSEVENHALRCPQTLAALAQAPLCRIGGRTPSVLFSLLRPGTRIRPHHGFTNARLICHLPLVIPRDCALRVGNETRPWHEGELVVFDDSIEHEAWNLSDEPRVVLIFDIWRPELTVQEQTLVAAILAAAAGQQRWTD
jgi:aspartate beta-hydroxylase